MKILVTGANGYLGQGIVTSILNYGHEVIATGIETNYVDDRAEKINCDLFSIENPYEFLENQIYYCIWHGEMGSYTIQIHT